MFVIRRSSHNPILAPVVDHPWEARGVFNPSPVKRGVITHVLYRALGKPDVLMTPSGISTIGKALTLDGHHFQNRRQFIIPEEEWERFGCEDPRVTYFEGTYVIFYTALSETPPRPSGIRVGVALSKDLEKIDERHLVTPFNAKAMALFPQRINGKITAILTAHTDEPPAKIAIAQCDRLEQLWDPEFWKGWQEEINSFWVNPLRFDHDHVEVGSPPVKTKDGWLMFYAYIQNYFGGGERVFGIEALLLDLLDPHTIVGRSKGPLMAPEEIYERYGLVPDVVFPTGCLLEKDGRLDLYYGAADTVCAKAFVNLSDVIADLKHDEQSELAVRAKQNPIITPDPKHAWEKRATFNAGAIDLGGKVHLLYRAMSEDNTSVFGYAASKDGVHISERLDQPAYVPREDFEMKRGPADGNSGCEDPRITKIGETIYMTYTAFNGVDPWRAALTSIGKKDFLAKRFDRWTKPVLISPEGIGDKNLCLFPEKIGGQYMLLHRIGSQICADFTDSLDFKNRKLTRCIEIMGPRPGVWDSQKIGITGPPIKTDKGWLLIYHGVSKTNTYRLGAALLDLVNPTIVLSRTTGPILEPVEEYERVGQIKNVVFSCGVVRRKDTLFVYYGGADSVLGVAKVALKRLLNVLLPHNLQHEH